VSTQLLSGGGKRLHLYSQLFDEGGQLLATGEQLLIHVSLETRRATPPAASLQQRLQEIETRQAALPRPGRLHCGQRD
jgi:carnitine 3-dehydrogenase